MNVDKQTNIGIIGLGFVGRVIYDWFGPTTRVYDKYSPGYQKDDINDAEIIFICVPTPYNNGFDDSEVVDALKKINSGKIVVIKSTVLPGSTKKYQKRFPKLKIMFNPEFLAEKTAKKDFEHPERQIMGVTTKSRDAAMHVMDILPLAPYSLIVDSSVAEMAKYANNVFLALKVTWAGEIYDICKSNGINYEQVKWIVGHDTRIGQSHMDVMDEEYRGFGGKCLPKDLKALIQFAEKNKVDVELLKMVNYINSQYVS